MNVRKMSVEELVNMPVQNGEIKILVLDGTGLGIKGVEVMCPIHGEVTTRIFKNRVDKISVHSEAKIELDGTVK